MTVHGDAEQEVVAHPFPQALPLVCVASVLPFNPCQCALQYKWYCRPPCIVLNLCFWFLNLCFWFRPGITSSQSLGFERVTDVLLDRATRVLSACQELGRVK